MVYNLIIASILIAAFFMCIASFTVGIKTGKSLSEGKVPSINLNPIKPIIEAVERHETKKEDKQLDDELTDIMGATRETMLKAIKSEVN